MISFRKSIAVLMFAALGALATQAFAAHPGYRSHSSVHLGLYFGAPYPVGPFYRPFGWPAPYYGYPYPAPVLVMPPVAVAPPVYVEQYPNGQSSVPPAYSAPPPPPAAARNNDWFWCPSAQAYYPYVGECGEPWQRVAPQR